VSASKTMERQAEYVTAVADVAPEYLFVIESRIVPSPSIASTAFRMTLMNT